MNRLSMRIAILPGLCLWILGAVSCASAESLFRRGLEAERGERNSEALEFYRAAVEADPDFVKASNNRALLLLKADQKAEALAEIERALQRQPRYAVGLVTRGNIREALGQNESALADYAAALEAAPELNEALFNRGNLLLKMRRPGEALTYLRQAHQALPDARDIAAARATAEKSAGDPAVALRIFRELQQQSPGSESLERHIAECLLALKEYQAARESFERLYARSGRSAYLFQAAVAAYAAQDLNNARSMLQQVIEKKPDEARAYYLLGMLDFKNNARASAIQNLQKYLELQQGDEETARRVQTLLQHLQGSQTAP
ncbi:MAG: tetratricopeptide repeat protein [Leptospirales bacterium]|nr:tetratricopeptide repeat protein [Leptospirales bacterium]